MMSYILIFFTLTILEVIYLKIASVKDIKDNPNHRTAHTNPTVRGGGIIVFLAIILYALVFPFDKEFICFLIALAIVALASFIDDLITLSSKVRMLSHLLAFTVLFYSFGFINYPSVFGILFLIIAYVFSIGFINIYNFMDGINGMTFLNTLLTYFTLLFLNESYVTFVDSNLLIILTLSIIVFGFFNFRKRAICFSGDIGSITIGFSIIYFVIKFYSKYQNPLIFLLLFAYLVDGGWTIVQRILKKENIFEAHRRHLYQLLVNDLKLSHLKVALLYFIVQLIINVLLIFSIKSNVNYLSITIITFFLLSIFYFFLKRKIMSIIKNKNNE